MRVRNQVLWVLSVAAVAALYLSAYNMAFRVLSVGGSCASGGAHVIRQQCPSGTGHWTAWMMLSLFAGIVLLFVDGGNTRVTWFIWSAIFLGMGVGGIIGAVSAWPNLSTVIGLGVGCGLVGLVIALPGVVGLISGPDTVQKWKAKSEGRTAASVPTPSTGPSPRQLQKLLDLAEQHGRGELGDTAYAAAKAKILRQR
ncbi:hypothetical protein [Mycolicibacterium sp. CBMA 226]|uniref:hypothetical protein n=1 Tax=Mycolicibacterium sp. CBMA 226 TaxID=2606611 RepID=UPI0012DDB86D|nr:hypothetical protein [Mycolicibacterium sp. CBMA 226]MUL79853.1 hypothetical protein [Mycolicibacterium sp. CBMA 226]